MTPTEKDNAPDVTEDNLAELRKMLEEVLTCVKAQYTKEDFLELRDRTAGNGRGRYPWQPSCKFLMDATKQDHPWSRLYRAHPWKYKIEHDVMEGLWAIGKDDNFQRWHHLRHFRRFFFRRYSFMKACIVSWQLLKLSKVENSGQGNRILLFIWLFKDVFAFRAGLALLLGYALVLGAGSTASVLQTLSHDPHRLNVGLRTSAVLLFVLIYLNARNQVGRLPHLWLRACGIEILIVGWVLFYCRLATWVLPATPCLWAEAWMLSAVAAPLSILAQFFFDSERSLTDPL